MGSARLLGHVTDNGLMTQMKAVKIANADSSFDMVKLV